MPNYRQLLPVNSYDTLSEFTSQKNKNRNTKKKNSNMFPYYSEKSQIFWNIKINLSIVPRQQKIAFFSPPKLLTEWSLATGKYLKTMCWDLSLWYYYAAYVWWLSACPLSINPTISFFFPSTPSAVNHKVLQPRVYGFLVLSTNLPTLITLTHCWFLLPLQ